MTIRNRVTLISAVLLSLCLLALVPGSLRFASTWMIAYIPTGGIRVQNYFMPLGLYSLALEIIGLVVLWTGYRTQERWAWFVMLTILTFFIFPSNVLPTLLNIHAGTYQWSLLLMGLREIRFSHCEGVECVNSGIAIGALEFIVMSVALFLPVKAFFWKKHTPAESQHKERDDASEGR